MERCVTKTGHGRIRTAEFFVLSGVEITAAHRSNKDSRCVYSSRGLNTLLNSRILKAGHPQSMLILLVRIRRASLPPSQTERND